MPSVLGLSVLVAYVTKIGRIVYELIKITILIIFSVSCMYRTSSDKTSLWYDVDPDLIRTGIGFVTILESNIF